MTERSYDPDKCSRVRVLADVRISHYSDENPIEELINQLDCFDLSLGDFNLVKIDGIMETVDE